MPKWQVDQGPTEGLGQDPLSTRYVSFIPQIHCHLLVGNAENFVNHILRIFDTDGNDFLSFKEFLLAMDIANCSTGKLFKSTQYFPSHIFAAQEKLNWAFKLYDIDNDGLVDMKEMAVIMETLDDIEGVKSGETEDDGNGNPDHIPTPLERAASLFAALDRNNDGSLTRKEFVASYTQRSTILRRQDADEQKRRLNCLLLYGPHVNRWRCKMSPILKRYGQYRLKQNNFLTFCKQGGWQLRRHIICLLPHQLQDQH